MIAASNNASMLEACLTSLAGQVTDDTEVIVVRNYDGEASERALGRFPFVKHVCLPADATVPELRAAGIRRAGGDVVALLEDHCVVGREWCSTIKTAHLLPYPAIGGSVENLGGSGRLDWAVYFYDYGKYMAAGGARVVDSLTGLNASYKRRALEGVAERFKDGFFETLIHDELRRRGYALYFLPSAVVYHNKSYEMGRALRQCYHFGRLFGGMRVSHAGPARRLAFLLGAPLLPFLLPARAALRTIRSKRHVRELVLSFPHLALLMAAWACGEFCGYAFGEGASSREWR